MRSDMKLDRWGLVTFSDRSFEALIDFSLEIGESPVWDDRRGVVWFVDILAPTIISCDPKNSGNYVFPHAGSYREHQPR